MAKSELCPICGKAATREHIPFCSKRCSDIDLGRWFKGSYAVPVVEMDDAPEEEDIPSPLEGEG